MKRNVSGQVMGAQMLNASTGGAFTGAVTVYITGDNGTQTLGAVGAGICVHKGNGYHSYMPSQAETNFGHIALTFIGTGAVPVTWQVYTNFPQTVDNETGIAAIKTVADAVQAKTDNLPSDPADQSLVVAATDALAATLAPLSMMDVRLLLVLKIFKNRLVTDPGLGTLTIFDDDDVTPILAGQLWKDATGTVPYSGTGIERRDRLA